VLKFPNTIFKHNEHQVDGCGGLIDCLKSGRSVGVNRIPILVDNLNLKNAIHFTIKEMFFSPG
jgi:hypothetical protein